MATPASRAEFKEYCLRNLGKPVVNIDVTDTQVDDRIDDALKFYYDYHYNGTDKVYYKHILTQEDIDNGFISMPENINGVVNIFDLGTSISSASGMFSIQYQIALNDLYSFSGVDLIPYWMTIENLQFMEEILVGRTPIRYNEHRNELHIDINKNKLSVGTYIVAECYEQLDAENYPDIWKDRWLIKYATALIKKQWGNNLSKFSGVQLPGGITFDGQRILAEATQEVLDLERDLIENYSTITAFMIG